MRISTASLYDTSIANLQRRQNTLQTQQQQLTSGKRVQHASDDPTAAARSERAQVEMARVDANQRALEASRNSMTLSEAALGDANDLMQQARETMVAAGNASYSDSERKGLADKLQGIRNQLLSIANRPDGSGGYLFSGQGSSNPPFLDQSSGVSYVGTPGTIQTGNLDRFQMSVDGRAAWEQARSGNGFFVTDAGTNPSSTPPGAAAQGWIDPGSVTNPSKLTGLNYSISITGTAPAAQTYTISPAPSDGTAATGTYKPGTSIGFDGLAVTISGAPVNGDNFSIAPATNSLKVFDVLDKAIGDLKTPLRTGTQIAQSNSSRLRDMDAVMGNMQSVRSQIGEQLNNLDGSESRLSGLKLYATQEKSAAEDVDMVQAISDFQNQQTGLQAAMTAYAQVQKLSLFQYVS